MKWTSQLIAIQMIIFALGSPSAFLTGSEAHSAIAAASAYAIPAAPAQETLPLREQIAAWVDQLSQEAEFSTWQHADFTVYPLGPGQHGWVAIVTSNEQEIGYLVVHVTQDGTSLSLTEYGNGPYPLFGQAALLHTLAWLDLRDQSGSAFENLAQLNTLDLTRHYKGPFEAVWEVNLAGQTYFFDAAVGDDYSLFQEEIQQQLLTPPYQPKSNLLLAERPYMTVNHQTANFDPYETLGWVGREGVSVDNWEQLRALLDKPAATVTYAPTIWFDQIRQPLALGGYQVWLDRQVYLRVQQGSSRYIPYQAIVEMGQMSAFYVDDSSFN